MQLWVGIGAYDERSIEPQRKDVIYHEQFYVDEEPISNTIERLQKILEDHPGATMYEDYDFDTKRVYVRYSKKETDEQFGCRMLRTAAVKERQEQIEHEQYLRLKAKFEGGNT